MTRHWLEAYVTEDCVSFNLICEHPKACMETGEQWRDAELDSDDRMTDDDRAFLRSAADSAPRVLGEWYGDAVACVLLDLSADEYPDANILELANRINHDAKRASRMAAVSIEGNRVPVSAPSNRLCCPWCGGKIYPDETDGQDRRVVGYDCDSCPARWDLAGDVINDGTPAVAS